MFILYDYADCGQLRNPENGQVLTTNGTTYMQVAMYTCDTGYYTKSGDDSQKCEADGTWSGDPLVCAIYGKLPISFALFSFHLLLRLLCELIVEIFSKLVVS
jgi:hypothetical protein